MDRAEAPPLRTIERREYHIALDRLVELGHTRTRGKVAAKVKRASDHQRFELREGDRVQVTADRGRGESGGRDRRQRRRRRDVAVRRAADGVVRADAEKVRAVALQAGARVARRV